ncbi:NAD(P)-dependent oxidoreductase [Spongiibacter nanhainus]|uniref:NAD(P)-dependent oxidoreductase n=1 Tax=Spongiibacter nanhainus TaxID=2794344 RepID=A0A7T4QYY6_9GAMM|nr:NAD(P)-dependent oxidoreductase [Spongiibacter nanhainus]QQD17365.1 NAD(P)-dependent oxidoreductase [Spongiibacter nanhainus]
MRVLVTGAFGNLGERCVEQLISAGHQVRCTDIDTAVSRARANRLRGRCDVVLSNICDHKQFPALVADVDAIIHLASILPPKSDRLPGLAYAVNVEATKALIDCAEKQAKRPLFVFPSSLTVFGPSNRDKPWRSPNDPVVATDNYTRHKIDVEAYLAASEVPWVVMRIGVSVDSRTWSTERQVIRTLLSVHPETPLEYIHPSDVARAFHRVLEVPEAAGKVLLLGGGKTCQVTHAQFLNAAFTALGFKQAQSIFGTNNYYTHWLDTEESQRMLGFQSTPFEQYQDELTQKFSSVRIAMLPLRPLLRPLVPRLLKYI